MRELIAAAFHQAADALTALQNNHQTLLRIEVAAALLVQTFKSHRRVYSCGNGGSMCDAMHFAEELSGQFRKPRPPLPAIAISDSAHLSCTANDFGYEHVFARFVSAHAQAGDTLLAISTSGASKNVIAAAQEAQRHKMRVIALTGRFDAALAAYADVHIATPGGSPYADRVQELHIKVIHTLIEACEHELFGKS